ncbi:MAG: hypothetical protein HY869_20140 [Chloroflexi bacterium]|nr:hypothetical protein [Chloroflexota bacterium]
MLISVDLITGALSFLFTVLIFSYLLGDNPLFRIGSYIFVGVTAGYVAAVAMWQVVYPQLLYPLVYGSMVDRILVFFPLLLTGFLFMKISPRTSYLGTPAMAYVAGISAAVTVGGAVLGTIFPQTLATIDIFDLARANSPFASLVSGVIILVSLVGTLAYFHFGARVTSDGTLRRFVVIELLSWVGRISIAITLGVLFAGVLLASLTAFIERIASWSIFFSSF